VNPAVQFEIKLSGGRIIGPVDLLRVRVLIQKNQVNGTEQARFYPDGEWTDINRFPEISDLLLERLQKGTEVFSRETSDQEADKTAAISSEQTSSAALPGLDPSNTIPVAEIPTAIPTQTEAPAEEASAPEPLTPEFEIQSSPEAAPPEVVAPPVELEEDEAEKTLLATQAQISSSDFSGDPDEEATMVASREQLEQSPSDAPPVSLEPEGDSDAQIAPPAEVPALDWSDSANSGERTMMFDTAKAAGDAGILSQEGKKQLKERGGLRKYLKPLLYGVIAALFALDQFEFDEKKPEPKKKAAVIRPKLPAYVEGQANQALSKQFYQKGLQTYSIDHVKGYIQSVNSFQRAAALDINNVQAVAMLASSYLRLIDSSNKDENYFQTISKLIELSRAKDVDLLETVLADIEFYLATNQLDAAEKRIDEYTRVNRQYGIDMFFYLGEISYRKRRFNRAVTFLNRIPDNKVFTPRVFYLRGKVAEELGFDEQAVQQYDRAIKQFSGHPKSRVRYAEVLDRLGRLREAKPHLSFLLKNEKLLNPPDRARAFFLAGRFFQLEQKNETALGLLERAVRYDPGNHDYLFEYFTLKASVSEGVEGAKAQARMFYFLGEGEKLVAEGKFEAALNSFLQARQANPDSAVPLVKIGNMFQKRKNYRNALLNFRKANKLAPKSSNIRAAYIESLIQNFEWEEAAQAIASYRLMAKKESTADRLTGELYLQQGALKEAVVFYRKAMSHREIDRRVYLAYANAMLRAGQAKEASFYFNLVRRFDPLNMDAVIGSARTVAELQGLDAAIDVVQGELQRLKEPRVELITAVGEFHFLKRQWEQATASFDEAIALNPDYAEPWLWKARIYLEGETDEKEPQVKALEAFKSYSDRNPSDPTGYLERYRVFVAQTKFDQASEELDKIFTLFPKYPAVHFYKGKLYAEMGNLQTAQREFEIELKNHPANVDAMLELGKVFIRAEKYKEALDLFNKAMVAQPTQSEPKHLAGWANYLLKNYMGAKALLLSAQKIDSGNPLIYKRMGEVYRTTGERASMNAAFEKYLQLAPGAPDREEIRNLME
jgi:tetratricopeptide (TPR) repeat protein